MMVLSRSLFLWRMQVGKQSGRRGKLVTGGHQSFIEGLQKFLGVLEKWDEIGSIRICRITNASAGGRSHNSSGPVRDMPRALGLGGGFTFRVNRWAQSGERITGIKCTASFGRSHQEVILTSSNYPALRVKLVEHGYLED